MIDITKGNLITRLCNDTKLPKMVKIRQNFDPPHIDPADIPAVVRAQLDRPEITGQIKPGMSIAITSGSRGVANVALITKAAVDFLKELGAEPFVFPAMGSHGGATAEGQKEVLAGFGVTEEYLGCPIKASMEVVQVGIVPDEGNMPVFTDRYAHEADGILLIGRIKAHTAFRGPYESGVVKMSVIGMGKQHGAETVHESGFINMGRIMPKVGRVVFDNNNIIAGLGLIENAYDQTCKIVGMTADEVWEQEPALLLEAKSRMGSILFEHADTLVVDKIGKDCSGDGMDPNVTGRFACADSAGSDGFTAQRIVVLGLTEETHHNANGIGMADVTTQRLIHDADMDITYPNSLTSTVLAVVKIPFITECDRTAIQLGIRSCNMIDKANPKVVRIRDTMHVRDILISEALLEEAKKDPRIEILSEPQEWVFNEEGNLW